MSGIQSQKCLIKLEENAEWKSMMRRVAGSEEEEGRRKGFWMISLPRIRIRKLTEKQVYGEFQHDRGRGKCGGD